MQPQKQKKQKQKAKKPTQAQAPKQQQQQKSGGGAAKNKKASGKKTAGGPKKASQPPSKPQQSKQDKNKQKVKKELNKKQKVSDTIGRKKSKTTDGGKVSSSKSKNTEARLQLIIKSKFQNVNKAPTKLESMICQYLVDIEASSKDLKPELRDLGIVAARNVNISNTKNAIIIFVPFQQHSRWQKVQDRLIRELEKKCGGKEVLIIAQRKVMKLCQISKVTNAPRPRTQTISAVQTAILDDVVYPTKIVGKRIRFRVGGKRLLKVYLDPKDSKDIESRLPTFEAVYRKLTKKNVKFLFPRYVI